MTAVAWDRGEVGIWYGGWTSDDLAGAERQANPAQNLSLCRNHIQNCNWNVSPQWYKTSQRFKKIGEDEWVLVVTSGKICLGQLRGPLQDRIKHPLNLRGECFKFRKVVSKKCFAIASLPAVYALVPQTGRGNVFEFHDLRPLIDILAQSATAAGVRNIINQLPLDDFIAYLGPGGWESLAEAFLIIKRGYIPVGLTVGRTLKSFDLIGRSRVDHVKLVAQCKNNRQPVRVAEDFIEAIGAKADVEAYYFAYGGVMDPPPGINIVTKDDMVEWLTSRGGMGYLQLLRHG